MQHDDNVLTELPTNPSGPIPSSIAVEIRESCPVFTPEEGGSLEMSSFSLTALPGAVQNHEFIAICMRNAGPASNAGMTHQRYTLQGDMYEITVFNSDGRRLSDYRLDTFVEACLPLPHNLRHRISDVELAAIGERKSQTILASTIVFAGVDLSACGPIGLLPATVAVAAEGAPDALPTPEPEEPETGGYAPDDIGMLALLISGLALFTVGFLTLRRIRRAFQVTNRF